MELVLNLKFCFFIACFWKIIAKRDKEKKNEKGNFAKKYENAFKVFSPLQNSQEQKG